MQTNVYGRDTFKQKVVDWKVGWRKVTKRGGRGWTDRKKELIPTELSMSGHK